MRSGVGPLDRLDEVGLGLEPLHVGGGQGGALGGPGVGHQERHAHRALGSVARRREA